MTNALSKLKIFNSISCNCYESVHTWDPSCIRVFFTLTLLAARAGFIIYFPLYLLPRLLTIRLSGNKHKSATGTNNDTSHPDQASSSSQLLLHQLAQVFTVCLKNASLSTAIIALNSSLVISLTCLNNSLTGRIFYLSPFFSSLLSHWLFSLERPSRRATLTMFATKSSFEIIFEMLDEKFSLRHKFNQKIAAVLLFSLATSINFYSLYSHPTFCQSKDLLNRLSFLVIGKAESRAVGNNSKRVIESNVETNRPGGRNTSEIERTPAETVTSSSSSSPSASASASFQSARNSLHYIRPLSTSEPLGVPQCAPVSQMERHFSPSELPGSCSCLTNPLSQGREKQIPLHHEEREKHLAGENEPLHSPDQGNPSLKRTSTSTSSSSSPYSPTCTLQKRTSSLSQGGGSVCITGQSDTMAMNNATAVHCDHPHHIPGILSPCSSSSSSCSSFLFSTDTSNKETGLFTPHLSPNEFTSASSAEHLGSGDIESQSKASSSSHPCTGQMCLLHNSQLGETSDGNNKRKNSNLCNSHLCHSLAPSSCHLQCILDNSPYVHESGTLDMTLASAFRSSLTAGIKFSSIGWLIQSALYLIRIRKDTSENGLLGLLSKLLMNTRAINFALFLGNLVTVYRCTWALLLRYDCRSSSLPRHALISGLLAGLASSSFFPSNQLSLYAFWKVLFTLYSVSQVSKSRGGRIFVDALFYLSDSFLINCMVMEPQYIARSYLRFIDSITGSYLTKFNIVSYNLLSGRVNSFRYGDTIAPLNADHASRKYLESAGTWLLQIIK